jgi:GNAT superfamily N-acetyltransferase
MNCLTIREPSTLERPVCAHLLPESFSGDWRHEYRIAVDERSASIVGAVAFADVGGLLQSLHIRTVLDRRSEGIGTQLLDYVLAEADRRQRAGVAATVTVERHGILHDFLQKRGFGRVSRYCMAEGGAPEVYARTCARCVRIAEMGRGKWLVVPLTAAMYQQAERLIQEYMSGLAAAERRACAAPIDFSFFELSQALFVDGVMQGVILTKHVPADDTVVFRLRVVRPEFQNTRASSALLMRAAKVCVDTGAKRLLFFYFDFADDTVAFVQRAGMKVIKTVETLVKKVIVSHEMVWTKPLRGSR